MCVLKTEIKVNVSLENWRRNDNLEIRLAIHIHKDYDTKMFSVKTEFMLSLSNLLSFRVLTRDFDYDNEHKKNVDISQSKNMNRSIRNVFYDSLEGKCKLQEFFSIFVCSKTEKRLLLLIGSSVRACLGKRLNVCYMLNILKVTINIKWFTEK